MKKTLYTLLTATSLMSTSFSASAEDPTAANAPAAAKTAAVAITESAPPVSYLGFQIRPLSFTEKSNNFKGSPREISVGNSHKIILSSENGSLTTNIKYKDKDQYYDIEAYERFSRELASMGMDPQKLQTQEDFYNALCAAVLAITKDRTIPSSNLVQLRKITASVFVGAPNLWMLRDLDKLSDHAHEISEVALNKYHLARLTDTIKGKMQGFVVNEETMTTIVKETFDKNIKSPDCPKEIKSTFLRLSEALTVAAYHCHTQNISPTTIFSKHSFGGELSGFLTMLFELDDRVYHNEELDILGSLCSLPGLPSLTDVQKEFATRWMNIVLSPSNVNKKLGAGLDN